MSRKIYNRLSFMAVSWLDESTLGSGHLHLTFCVDAYIVKGFASTSGMYREEVRQARPI
jgi:hypothetical protein